MKKNRGKIVAMNPGNEKNHKSDNRNLNKYEYGYLSYQYTNSKNKGYSNI